MVSIILFFLTALMQEEKGPHKPWWGGMGGSKTALTTLNQVKPVVTALQYKPFLKERG